MQPSALFCPPTSSDVADYVGRSPKRGTDLEIRASEGGASSLASALALAYNFTLPWKWYT